MAFNTAKIERRPWTIEEKTSALKSCASKCACCGKKLNMKTLTMEHVVPISKGGENVLDNLVVLCNECNSRKGNKFYLPLGYYMALNDKSKLIAIDNYTSKWIKENITSDNLIEYPMFTEGLSLFLKPKEMRYNFKNGAYIPSLILDMYDVDKYECRPILKSLNIREKDIMDSVYNKEDTFSLIAAKKRTSTDYIGLYTLQIVRGTIFISEVYSTSWMINRAILIGFITTFAKRWAEYNVDVCVLRCKDEKTTNGIYSYYCNNLISMPIKYSMNSFNQFDYEDKLETIYGENQLCVKLFGKDECKLLDAQELARKSMSIN